jgi:hypothetical protein
MQTGNMVSTGASSNMIMTPAMGVQANNMIGAQQAANINSMPTNYHQCKVLIGLNLYLF